MHKIKSHFILLVSLSLLPAYSFAAGIPAEVFLIPAILVISVFVSVIILIIYGLWGIRKNTFKSRRKIFIFNSINVILFILFIIPNMYLAAHFALIPKLIILLPSFMQIYLFIKLQSVNA